MRKFTFIALAILIVSSVSAQSFRKENLPHKIVNETFQVPGYHQQSATTTLQNSKGINANLLQNFDVTTFPPAGWDTIGTPDDDGNPPTPTGWKNSASIPTTWESAATPSGHFAYFDCFLIPIGGVSSLVTPVLHPVSGNNTLTYTVNYYLLNSAYIATGTTMFIEFSTNGTTWTTSTTNVLAALPSYNTATTGWQTLTVNLATYNGQAVQVRFRAVSDYGGFGLGIDDVTGPEADIVTTVNDIQLTDAWADFNGLGYYGVTPVSQLGPVEFFGIAANNGSASQTNVVFDADVNNGSFFTYPLNNSLTIASGSYDTLGVSTTLSGTLPETFGARVFLTQDQTDEVPTNNYDSIYFSSDYTTYLRCSNFDVYVTPYSFGTSAPATSGMIYGSSYHFNVNDQIDSVFVLTYKNSGTTSLKAVLFDASTGVQVDSSAALVLSPSATIQEHKLALVSPYQVIGGTVLIAGIKMTFTTGVDTVYMLAQGSSFPGDVNQASMCYLRVSNAWDWYNVSFVPFVGLITDGPTNVEMLSNNGEVSVYPNPTTGILNITNAENATVSVFNIMGQEVMSAYNVKTLDMNNMANGSYFVKVQTNSNVITKKINLVK